MSFCKIYDAIQLGYHPNVAEERFDESMLMYALDVLRRKYRDHADFLDSLLHIEAENLKKSIRAQQRSDRAFLIKEEKEYLAKGGNSQDSHMDRMRKKYPLLYQVVDIYNYCDDVFCDLVKRQVISSRADSVSIFRYLDDKVYKGNGLVVKNPCSPDAPRHAFLVAIILENFPKRTDLDIARARLEQKAFFEKEDMEKKESLEYTSLCEQGANLRKTALDKQRKREKKHERDCLKSNFVSWMVLAKAKLDQRAKSKSLDALVQVSYLKNVWSKWSGAIALKKQEYFEQNVIMPNKNYTKQVDLMRQQRDCLPEDLESEYPVLVVNHHEQDIGMNESFLIADQKKADNRLAKIQRRQHRRDVKDAVSANIKHQQEVGLKKIGRNVDENILLDYFSSWKKLSLQSQNSSPVLPVTTLICQQSSLKVYETSSLVSVEGSYWRHDPYALSFKKVC